MSPADETRDPVLTAVTVIVGVIVGLTFLFGFGNVFALAVRLGVPTWVAPLVAPAVDLSVVGLLVGIRHLSMHGADPEVVRPARLLLLGSSVVTLALNVAEPLVAGDVGKALFNAVGPSLLIGWAEVGPGLLHAVAAVSIPAYPAEADSISRISKSPAASATSTQHPADFQELRDIDAELLERARAEDRRHRERHQRPISAETLRLTLGVGAERSRILVKAVRTEWSMSA
jgi:hypothetical protein